MKTLLALLIFCATTAWSAQIGDSVESKLSLENRIPVPNNQSIAVRTITLDDGVWAVSGLVDYFVSGLDTNAYIGASINTELLISTDGTGLFTTVAGPPPLSFNFPGLALPSKVIEISGNGVPVYLVGWRWTGLPPINVNAQAQAWGFISARKIRNNH